MTIRFSICAEMIFPKLSFADRIARVAESGFEAIEFWTWKDKPLNAVAAHCAELGIVVTNMSGNRAGSLIDPLDFDVCRGEALASVGAAKTVSCENLMLLTNPLGPDGKVVQTYPEISPEKKRANCERALHQLASVTVEEGIRLLVEPLNTVIDHPGYWLDDADCAFELIRAVNAPNVRLLYDLYHMRAMGRDVRNDLEGNLELIGYLHAADFPGRHEPGTGEMDYPSILRLLRSLDYRGVIGFEFSPADSSDDALQAIRRLEEFCG